MPTPRLASVLLTIAVLAGCSGQGGQDNRPDLAVTDLQSQADQPPKPDVRRDTPVAPDTPPLTSYKVAAIQYGIGAYTQVPTCSSDPQAIIYFVKEAKKNGAQLVVAPESAFGAAGTIGELAPSVGDKPAEGARWKAGTIINAMAALARDEALTIVFNLVTLDGGKSYITNLAIGPDGKVLARHHKFQLFGNEASTYAAGTSSDSSFFDTPAGRAGMLICADVQCIVLDLKPDVEYCSAASIAILTDYFSTSKKPDIVIFSSFWVGGANDPKWKPITVQKKVATYSNAYLIAANTTNGVGKGGGIYKSGGDPIVMDDTGKPMVLYAELPLKK